MPDLALDLRFLRYAILAAEQGSFRRAAEFANLSPTTISRRIESLEQRVGVLLFERNRQGARLTAAGKHFIRDAEVAVNQLTRAIQQSRLVHRGELGELHIGITTSIGDGSLGELIRSYRVLYPQMKLKLEELSCESAGAKVLSGRLDIAILPRGDRFDGCEHLYLWDEDVVVAVSKRHRLASSDAVTWEDLRDETFLVSADAEGEEIEQFLLSRFAAYSMLLKVSEQTVSRENLLNMAAHDFGVVSILASPASAHRADLRFLRPGIGDEKIGIHAVWLPGHQTAVVDRFIELARLPANAAAALNARS
jgi:DNA-binding transcriptional LysR family regulator